MTLKCIIEATLKSLHTEQFHLYDNMEKAKLKEEKNQWLPGVEGREEDWLTTKGPEGTFWDDGNVLYLDCSSGYMIVFVKIHRW